MFNFKPYFILIVFFKDNDIIVSKKSKYVYKIEIIYEYQGSSKLLRLIPLNKYN